MTQDAAARTGRGNEIVVDPRSLGTETEGELTHRGLTWLAPALLSLLAIAIVAPMFRAALGPIDDHWIVRLARDGAVPVFEPDRFRPGYWLIYVAEVALHGTNAQGWFLDRLLLALATAGAGYMLARLWLTPVHAVLAAALMLVGIQQEAFARLGPQEAFAVPLMLAGLAMVGRQRFAGLLLVTTAAFVKEPFVLPALLAVGWAWRLGARWSLVLPCVAVVIAGAGIAVVVARGAYRPLMFEGRYLYPWIVPVAVIAARLATRRLVMLFLGLWLAVNLVVQTDASVARAEATQRFQAAIATVHGHPYLLTGSPGEYASAIDAYLEGTPQEGPCVEVAVNAEPTGRCPAAVRLP